MAVGGNKAPRSDVGLQMVSDLGLASRGFESSTVARGQTSSFGVYLVVPFFGLTNSILRILKGNPKKELQWRL